MERTGDKIVDLLHRSDAWARQDCTREDYWPCSSAGEDGMKGDCKRRSIIYETYCEICGVIGENKKDKSTEDKEEMLEKIGKRRREDSANRETGKEAKEVCNQKKDYRVKYIGETWRTAYERGIEHQEDLKFLRERSHLLKHDLEAHPKKKIEDATNN